MAFENPILIRQHKRAYLMAIGGTSAHNTGPAEWEKKIASGQVKAIAVAAA